MKKFLSFLAVTMLCTIVLGQPGKTVSKTITPKPVSTLKTINDSFSYALGVQVAAFYKQQGVKKINAAILTKAVNDVYSNRKSMLSQNDIDLVIMAETSPEQYAQCKTNLTTGERFLKENKTKSGIITTPSGLEYEVMVQGTGPRPTMQDTVVCHYKGSLLNGTIFDESYTKNMPAMFGLTNVIKGWTEALLLMPVGSKYKLYLPCELGYGIMDYGAIPGGSALVFEIELIEVKKAGH